MKSVATRHPPLAEVIDRLEAAYGSPGRPRTDDPWESILRENVVYLADDESREAAFRALRKEVGTRPRDILKASPLKLQRISGMAGILPENSARKVRQAAEIAETEFGGELRQVLEWPVPKAKRALKKFPGIGDPGAEKLLMMAGRLPVLALESNGLRSLVRLGFASEGRSYAATYRAAQGSAMKGAPSDAGWFIKAHQLLRKHGKETCKQSDPLCESCALNRVCPFLKRS